MEEDIRQIEAFPPPGYKQTISRMISGYVVQRDTKTADACRAQGTRPKYTPKVHTHNERLELASGVY